MAGFTIDLAGRVKNFNLPKKKPLIPLFEAIVNSIYAIEERQEKENFDGYIKVEIIREPQAVVQIDGIDSSINDIIGFNVTDNGIGLDENNMRSFLQSDSTYRAEKGGKGVGRFAWLKAFEQTEIESVFKYRCKLTNRHFWAEEYYVGTVGLNEATIKKYIQEQEQHDIALDKLSVKEYEDPFKGSK